VPPYDHFMNRPWWGFFGWLVPLLIVAILVGAAVWVVSRATRERPPAVPPVGWMPPQPAASDPALEHARMRYARGEITRDEFLRMWSDLGGAIDTPGPSVAPPPPAAAAPAGAAGPADGSPDA
jgi:uncharacterized membrane protein